MCVNNVIRAKARDKLYLIVEKMIDWKDFI